MTQLSTNLTRFSRLIVILVCFVWATVALAAAPADEFKAATERANIKTGLAVHVGASDLVIARSLRDAGAAHVLVVVDETAIGQELREQLAKAKQLGPIEVLDRVDPKRIPLVDEAALLLVVEDGEKANEAELLRVVRPHGTLLRGDRATIKPWPEGYDGWYDYYYNASGNELSNDAKAGPMIALQWTAGDASTQGQVGFRLVNGVLLASEERGRQPGQSGGRWANHSLVARDAFTGLILWQRPDLKLQNTYAFDVDDKRVYVHPVGEKHQVGLDLKTGKTLVTYDQGVTVDPESYTKRYRIPFWQSMVHEGTLVQVHGSELIALEASTGKRLWSHDFVDDKLMPYVPVFADGKLVVVAGHKAEMSWAYNAGWRSMQLSQLRAYDPQTGKLAWTWEDTTKFDRYVQNMCYRDGSIGMMVWAMPRGTEDRRHIRREDGFFSLLTFEPTGKLRWETVIQDKLGAGHGNHHRSLIADGKLWWTNTNRMVGYDLKSGKRVADASAVVAPLCNVVRGTRNLLFHGAGAGAMDKSTFLSVTATRPQCDTGSYPGFGRLFVSQTNCGCTQFLPGTTAGLPKADTHEFAGERLQSGISFNGKPKATVARLSESSSPQTPDSESQATEYADAPGLPLNEKDPGWPAYLGDAERSLWVDTEISAKPTIAWNHQHTDPLDDVSEAERSDREENPWRCGPITAPVVAEGIASYALTDSGVIIARDIISGEQTWQAVLEGRIDSPPTIHQGLVLCGTRAGWVYALNRETGRLVWRFLAAPHQRQTLAQGATESVWPVNGAVTVVDNVVWCNAGRSMETDGGLWIWGLDVFTGEVKHKTRLDGTMDWKPTSERVEKHRSYNLGQPFIHSAEYGLLLLYEAAVKSKTGEAMTSMETTYLHVPHGSAPPNRLKRSNIRTLVYNGMDQQGKYGDGMMYAGVKGKLIAHRGDSMVVLLDNGGVGGRGGGPKSGAVSLWNIGKRPVETRAPALGKPVWELEPRGNLLRRDRDDWPLFQTLAVAGDTILLNHGDTLHLLELETGLSRIAVKLPALPVFAGIAIGGDGRIVMTCRDGSVICLK